MTENQFWWATIGEGEAEVVNVRFDNGKPAHVFSTGPEFDFEARDFEDLRVRLIERVLPAGRAAAAVEKLEEIVSSSWHVDQATEGSMKVIDILQDGESQA